MTCHFAYLSTFVLMSVTCDLMSASSTNSVLVGELGSESFHGQATFSNQEKE